LTVGDCLRFKKEEAAHELGNVRSMMLRDEVGALALFRRDADREKKRAHQPRHLRMMAMTTAATHTAITQCSIVVHIPNVYTIRGAGATERLYTPALSMRFRRGRGTSMRTIARLDVRKRREP
jgi:hypothetical protein